MVLPSLGPAERDNRKKQFEQLVVGKGTCRKGSKGEKDFVGKRQRGRKKTSKEIAEHLSPVIKGKKVSIKEKSCISVRGGGLGTVNRSM